MDGDHPGIPADIYRIGEGARIEFDDTDGVILVVCDDGNTKVRINCDTVRLPADRHCSHRYVCGQIDQLYAIVTGKRHDREAATGIDRDLPRTPACRYGRHHVAGGQCDQGNGARFFICDDGEPTVRMNRDTAGFAPGQGKRAVDCMIGIDNLVRPVITGLRMDIEDKRQIKQRRKQNDKCTQTAMGHRIRSQHDSPPWDPAGRRTGGSCCGR